MNQNGLRADLKVLASMIEPRSTVLDIGCGEGDLLAWLEANRQVRGRGIELSQSGVNACIARGLSVIQGDADTDLADYPTGAYDYAVLSHTLQTLRAPREVLEHLVRIARHAVVSVPNFGYWKNRLFLLTRGRMPVTSSLSYSWYETPNIHFCTLSDFTELAREIGLEIEKQVYVSKDGTPSPISNHSRLANLIGEQGVFMVRKR